jgi:hypothetical protein
MDVLRLRSQIAERLTAIFPEGHDVDEVAQEIARVVDLPPASVRCAHA